MWGRAFVGRTAVLISRLATRRLVVRAAGGGGAAAGVVGGAGGGGGGRGGGGGGGGGVVWGGGGGGGVPGTWRRGGGGNNWNNAGNWTSPSGAGVPTGGDTVFMANSAFALGFGENVVYDYTGA